MSHRFYPALWLLVLALLTSAVRSAADESSPYGINIHAPSGAELQLLLDRAQSAGLGWVRIDFVWAYVEPKQGVFDWSLYDEIAAAAQARGLQIYATLAYTPGWATHGPEFFGVPDNPADWADVCFRAARHFQGSIRYWGMWNEPNLAQFWAGSMQQYIDVILKGGADAIHAGNPQAQVGGPDLAHLSSADWFTWLQASIHQASDRLDFVAHHVYDKDGNRAVTKKLEDSTLFGDRPNLWSVSPPSVKEVLVATGWFGKPFWLTETGWATDQTSEAAQAAYYNGLLTDWYTGLTERGWVKKVFFYEAKDSADTTNPRWGMLRPDGSGKPAYTAYHDFIFRNTPEVDDAHRVAENLPDRMEAGQGIVVRVTVQNTGTTTWTAAGGYKLGAVGDHDPFAEPRQLLAAGESVAPGKQRTFAFRMTAPAAGSYPSTWRMVREGVRFFGDTLARTVKVDAAPAPSARDLSLLGGRFRVEVSWRDHSGRAGFGRAIPATRETGFFWFFDPSNTELVVKMLDGGTVNGKYWAFYGALSDVEYWIDVTDTATGAVHEYHNPDGNLCGGADTSAFPSAPHAAVAGGLGGSDLALGGSPLLAALAPLPASAPSTLAAAVACVPDAQSLCLLSGQFKVSVQFRNPNDGTTGAGQAVPGSDASGTFWFFSPTNTELVVKALDGRALNSKYWIFYGALSNVEYWVTVQDLATGASKRYHNRQGNLCGLADTGAF
ncbi:MAG TPA: NBR1-Ig-like domain-containing protein [Thermoanaerobaculia bacterium]|nr:NBR1-Ig-like domain-containing protein [Thermoanaerobaculia bacterium]